VRVELIKILNIRVASSRSVYRSATPTLIGRSERRYIVYMYVWMEVCMYVYCVCVCTYVCMYMYVYVCMYVCMCVCMCVHIVTWTAFSYHTLHRQPIPITGIARLYAVLCRTISDCHAKQFKVRLCIRPCAPVSLLFYSRVLKTLKHSRSLKSAVRVMSRI